MTQSAFLLLPREMILRNNFVVINARNKFENSANKRPPLARRWINVPELRPSILELDVRRRGSDDHNDPVLKVAAQGRRSGLLLCKDRAKL